MSEKRFEKITAEDAPKDKSICGFRSRIMKAEDGVPASVSRLRISDATAHWHEHTHEYYYVLDGEGVLIIDGDQVALAPGDCVWIKPGAVHQAVGDIEALVIGIPPFSMDDQFMVEGE